MIIALSPLRLEKLVLVYRHPYRKPTLVGWGKNPKVIERTLVKELGNLTP